MQRKGGILLLTEVGPLLDLRLPEEVDYAFDGEVKRLTPASIAGNDMIEIPSKYEEEYAIPVKNQHGDEIRVTVIIPTSEGQNSFDVLCKLPQIIRNLRANPPPFSETEVIPRVLRNIGKDLQITSSLL